MVTEKVTNHHCALLG